MCIFSAGRNMKQKLCHGSSGPGRHGRAERSKKADRSRRQRLQLRKLFGNANSSITCCGLARATAKNGIIFVRIPYEADWSRPPMIGLTQVRSTDWNSKRPLKNMPNRLVFRPIAFPKSAPSSIQQPQNGCSRCRRLRQNMKTAASDRRYNPIPVPRSWRRKLLDCRPC